MHSLQQKLTKSKSRKTAAKVLPFRKPDDDHPQDRFTDAIRRAGSAVITGDHERAPALLDELDAVEREMMDAIVGSNGWGFRCPLSMLADAMRDLHRLDRRRAQLYSLIIETGTPAPVIDLQAWRVAKAVTA